MAVESDIRVEVEVFDEDLAVRRRPLEEALTADAVLSVVDENSPRLPERTPSPRVPATLLSHGSSRGASLGAAAALAAVQRRAMT